MKSSIYKDFSGVFKGRKRGRFFFFSLLNQFAWVLITTLHRLGDLHNRNLFSHSSEGQKSNIRVPIGLVSGETSLPGLRLQTSCYVFTQPQTHVFSSSYKNISQIVLRSYSYKNYILKGPISKYNHILAQSFNIWIWVGGKAVQSIHSDQNYPCANVIEEGLSPGNQNRVIW